MPRITKQPLPGRVFMSCSGGGPKGAWLVGADQHLREEAGLRDEDVVGIYGTSTGSLFAAKKAAAIATGDKTHYADLAHIYTHVNNADILKPTSDLAFALAGEEGLFAAAAISGSPSLYSTAPLEALIERFLTAADWDAIIVAGARGELEVGFTAVSLQSGQAKVFTNISHPDPDVLKKALLASSNQPVLMPAIEIEGEQWVDGGLRQYNPIESVFAAPLFSKAAGILALSLDHQLGPDPSTERRENVMSTLLRTLDLLTDQVYDANVAKAALVNTLLHARQKMSAADFRDLLNTLPPEMKQELGAREPTQIIHIHPLSPLPVSGLSFDPKLMRRALRQGFRDTARQVMRREGAQDVQV